MEITYAWLNTFCGDEERNLIEEIDTQIKKERLAHCRCGELKVVVSGDFVNLSYKARILCKCNAIEREFRGMLRRYPTS